MHYYIEDSAFLWALLVETRNKQIFKVDIEIKNELMGDIEICYANPKNIVVNIFISGNQRIPIDELWLWLSLDLEKIIEKYCHWDVIEYFFKDIVSNGNVGIIYHGFLRNIKERRFDSQNP